MSETKDSLWQIKADALDANNVILNSKKGYVISVISIHNKQTILILNDKQELQLVNVETFKTIKTIVLKNEGQILGKQFSTDYCNGEWFLTYFTIDITSDNSCLYLYNLTTNKNQYIGNISHYGVTDMQFLQINEIPYIYLTIEDYQANTIILEKWNIINQTQEAVINFRDCCKAVTEVVEYQKNSYLFIKLSTSDNMYDVEFYVVNADNMTIVDDKISAEDCKNHAIIRNWNILIFTHQNDNLIFWDIFKQELLYSFPFSEDDQFSINPLTPAINDENESLLIVKGKKCIYIYNINRGGLPFISDNQGLVNSSFLITTYKDESVLITIEKGKATLWSLNTFKPILSIAVPYLGSEIKIKKVIYPYQRADGKATFIIASKNKVVLWYPEGVWNPIKIQSRLTTFTYQEKDYLLTANNNGYYTVIDPNTGIEINKSEKQNFELQDVINLQVFTQKSQTKLFVLYSGKIEIYSLPQLSKLMEESLPCGNSAFGLFYNQQSEKSEFVIAVDNKIVTWDINNSITTAHPILLTNQDHTLCGEGFNLQGICLDNKNVALLSQFDAQDENYIWDINTCNRVELWDFVDEAIDKALSDAYSYHIQYADAVSVGGKQLVVLALYGGAVALYNFSTRKRVGPVLSTCKNGEVLQINIIRYQDKCVLAIATEKGNLRLYDLINKNKLLRKYMFNNIHDITSIGNKLLVSYQDNLTALDLTKVLDSAESI